MPDTITPCFWFDGDAEEAVNFYTSLFAESTIDATSYYGEGAPLPTGTVMTISFTLPGRPFLAINGGQDHHHRFNVPDFFPPCGRERRRK
jgi:predicted 3-demethylubiquinone-9 3-methyltransferase (glyoxalase superfamily)